MNETWKTVDFGTGLDHARYDVSNRGRVKSYANNRIRIIKGSKLNGYRSLMVRFEGGLIQNFYVHRLVAQYFVRREKPDQYYVIHLDYDKLNNDMHNLAWVDEEGLKQHNNNNPNIQRKRATGHKLNEAKVKAIKKLVKSNKTRLRVIAKRFDISHTHLNRIRHGENWSNITIDTETLKNKNE